MTRIVGKELSLDSSIEKMSRLLRDHGFDLEQSNWLNAIPNVWSVQLEDKECPLLCTVGKGVSKKAALASALGGFLERVSCNSFFASFYFGSTQSKASFVHYPNERWFPIEGDSIPEGLLDDATLSHYNMDDELKARMLVDFNSANNDRGICALPFMHQSTGCEVWFPVSIIGGLYINHGTATGCSSFEARVQALSEIFEHHIKNTILSSGISLPRVPESIVAQYPIIEETLEVLRAHGYLVYILDASLGGKFPLVNVTLFNSEDGGCFSSFGAHPKFEVALQRAVTELLHGRALDSLGAFLEPVFDLRLVADQRNIESHFTDSSGLVSWDLFSNDPDYQFAEWNVDGDSEAEFYHLCHLIHRVDMDIYISDYEYMGIYACRIIVPGMSDIFPVELLVRNNKNGLAEQRDVFGRMALAHDDELESLLRVIEEADIEGGKFVADLLGFAPDVDSRYIDLSISELKCLLYMRLGLNEAAAKENEWLVLSGFLAPARLKQQRCLGQLLRLSFQDGVCFGEIKSVLVDLYGEELVLLCQEMLQGRRIFDDFQPIDSDLVCFKRHSSLLAAYKRLGRFK